MALTLHYLTILPNRVDKNGLGKSTKESWKLSTNCFPLLLKAPTCLWCANNPTKKLNLNVNKLANVRRDIVNRERLTKMKLPAIQLSVMQRVENTTPYTRDANAVPEEQNASNNQEIDKNSKSDVQEPLSIDTQDETVGIIEESILQRYKIAKETPISQRSPIPNIKNERHAKSAIEKANKAILSHQPDKRPISLTDINHLVYATSSTVKESLGIKTKRNNKLRKPNQPKWKKKIEGEIYKIRGDVSTLNEIKHEKPVKEKRKKTLFSKHNIKQEEQYQQSLKN